MLRVEKKKNTSVQKTRWDCFFLRFGGFPRSQGLRSSPVRSKNTACCLFGPGTCKRVGRKAFPSFVLICSENKSEESRTNRGTPPSKNITYAKKFWRIILGAIATIRRNQLRKRILQEIFSKELRKFRVAQH